MQANDLTEPYAGRAPWVEAGGKILERTAKKLSRQYGMQVTGSGGSLMNNIDGLTLSFQLRGAHNIDEARLLIVDCVRVFLEEINQDVKARPFLSHYPFNVNDISMMVGFCKRGGENFVYPQLGMVSVCRGTVQYKSESQDNPYRYELLFKETYAEALAQVDNGL